MLEDVGAPMVIFNPKYVPTLCRPRATSSRINTSCNEESAYCKLFLEQGAYVAVDEVEEEELVELHLRSSLTLSCIRRCVTVGVNLTLYHDRFAVRS